MTRAYNFSAGPATLFDSVLSEAQADLMNWQNSGVSMLELSHRTPPFRELLATAIADLRELLTIPEHYKVLFLSGPARTHFSAVPLNLLGSHTKADYFYTGVWSEYAMEEAKRYCEVNCVATGEASGFQTIPEQSTWAYSDDAAYVHFTDNETINGVQFQTPPEGASAPLVCDMTSSILSRPIPVSQFGMIYAGTQKNVGCAGASIVIIREDLLERAHRMTPRVINYTDILRADNLPYTPATFSYYIMALSLQHLKATGGMVKMAERNDAKAARLYAAIDASTFYRNTVDTRVRSVMNVPFQLADDALNEVFLTEAKQHNLVGLKGHRLVGGMRASIYNAMPAEGVDALIHFMKTFEQQHG